MAFSITEQARKEANLRLLQRSSDPTISEILGSATHVVLYQFQQSTQTWEKSNVEGSLFLAVRPLGYSLIILNRSSPENFVQPLERDFQLQHKDPYLIFKQQQQGVTAIRGIWFPNSDERVQMNDLLLQILHTLRMAPVANPPPPAAAPVVEPVSVTPAQVPDSIQPTSSTIPSNVDPGAAMAALLSPMTLGTSANVSTASGASARNTSGSALPPLATPAPASSTYPASASNHNNNTTAPRHVSPSGGQPPMLDKKSLQLALLSLIQDDRFLDLLHAQYLKVAHARANRSRTPSSSDS